MLKTKNQNHLEMIRFVPVVTADGGGKMDDNMPHTDDSVVAWYVSSPHTEDNTVLWLLTAPDNTGPVPGRKWLIISLRRRIKRRKTS